MGNVKMVVDRLFIEQEGYNLVFVKGNDGRVTVEKHWVEEDGSDGVSVVVLEKEETEALVQYLETGTYRE